MKISLFVHQNILAHAKLQNPTTTPSGRISNEPEEEREKERREKNAIYSGHLRLCLQPMGSTHTPLKPMYSHDLMYYFTILYYVADTKKLNVIKTHKKKTNNQRSPTSTLD